jgi:flagellar hook-basal body complex protein FliE
MPGPILPISAGAIPDAGVAPIRPAGDAGGGAFQDMLTGAVQKVEGLGQDASASVQQFLSGEGGELHTTILATERAELAFELFQQVRNKVVSAYQEIMRMQM